MKNALLISILCAIGTNTVFADGTEPIDNDSNGKREVSTLEHLIWISTNSVGLAYHYEQTADIDASITQFWDDSDDDTDGNFYNDPNDVTAAGGNDGWLPIGNGSSPFTGTYDGRGFKIIGLTVNRQSNFQGFFGQTSNAVIENLGIENGSIAGSNYTGGLMGITANSIVTNCYSSCSVSGATEVGGIAGRNYASVIDSSYATGNVSGSEEVGGLVGYSRNSASISNSYASGQVSGALYRIGGLVGYNNASLIDSCHAGGSVSGYQHVGGLVGQHQSSSIKKSYAIGATSGWKNIGGLVGSLWEGQLNIAYAAGEVSATGTNAGGLAGYVYGTSYVDNCYTTGNVTRTAGTDTIFGAFIGFNHPNATVSHSYTIGSVFYDGADDPADDGFTGNELGNVFTYNFWEMQTSNQNAANGATGLPSVSMRNMVTFTGGGWDFAGETDNGTEEIWTMESGMQVSFPYLTDLPQDPLPGLVELVFAGGDGTPGNPYQVESLAQLDHVRYQPDFSYILINDIEAAETSTWDDGNGGEAEGWMPIGNYHTRFTGSFNGKNHTISGLYIHRPGTDYIGLFGYIFEGKLDSIVLEDLTVTGDWYVGGLTSYSADYSSINACAARGVVVGTQNVGGLVGWNENSTISSSFSETGVNCSRSNAGGLIGTNYQLSKVHNCYSRSDVTRTDDSYSSFGAFVGANSNAEILYSYSTGNVYFSNAEDPTNSGFIGTENLGGTLMANFFDSEASNQSSAIGAIAASTTIMTYKALYRDAGWDLMAETANGTEDTWGINPEHNNGYPFLRWQGYKLLTEVTEWPTSGNLACGEALSEASLTGGSATVEGTFSFVNPGTVPVYGTNDYAVKFTPTDQQNYAVLTGTVSVTVEDNTDPVITSVHDDQVLESSEGCGTVLPDYTAELTATDICDDDLSISQSPVPGALVEGTVNVVTLTVTDDASNIAEVTFNVVVLDNTMPVITSTHNDQEVDADAACQASLPDYTSDLVVTDNCDSELTLTQSPKPGSVIAGDANLVTLQATDDAGNATEATFNVAVIDHTLPVITSIHDDQVLDADAACEASLPDYTTDLVVTDNCDGDLAITQTPEPGSAVGGEVNPVTLLVSDDAGNTAEAVFNVTVADVTAPVLTCAGNQEFDAGTSGTYTVTGTAFDPVSIDDNCEIASIENDFTGSPSLDGAELPVGTTTLTWTATDASGNSQTCISEITVNATTDIEEWRAMNISFYPNPAKDEIEVIFGSALTERGTIKISITDMGGKMCKTAVCEHNCVNMSVNITDLDAGMYIIRIENEEFTATRMLVKQ